jgi:hypothetical protein
MPGLAYTVRDGTAWKEVTRGPADLLDLAAEVEQAITPLQAARRAVTASPLRAP